MDTNSAPVRRPLQLRFDPPDWPGRWHLTGFDWTSAGYGTAPCCEWTDDVGAKTWLPARPVDLAAEIEAPWSRRKAMIERARHFLGRLRTTAGIKA